MTTQDSTASQAPSAPAAAGTEVEQEEERRRRKLLLLLLLFVAIAAVATYLILRATGSSTSDLPGIGSTELPTYQFSFYGVARPLGVAVNRAGDRVYVTESDGPRLVHVYDRDGKHLGTLGPPTKSSGLAHVPVYVAVDPVNDDVYVSDRITQSVYVYNARGAYKRTFQPSRTEIGGGWQPLGLAFDAEGRLYVTDVSGPANRILSFDRAGGLLRIFGASAHLSFPNGLAVDGLGNVYVADSNNGRVVVFDRTGRLVAGVGQGAGAERFGLPRGVALDGKNRLFVVDTTDQSVQVLKVPGSGTPLPELIGGFGQEGSVEGAFEYPNGDAVDGSGRVYVTDRENNRVQVWSY